MPHSNPTDNSNVTRFPSAHRVVGMCVLAPCSLPVSSREPHIRLRDGSPVHMDCVTAMMNLPVRDTPIHKFPTANLLPIALLEDQEPW